MGSTPAAEATGTAETAKAGGSTAAAMMLPRLVLLVAALLAVSLGHVTAHLCGPAPSMPALCAHCDDVHGGGGEEHMVAAAEHTSAHLSIVTSGTDSDQPNPVVLCLAAVAALLVVLVLRLLGPGRLPEGVRSPGERPRRLPPARGSPAAPFALSLRRVAVLRV
ncbi:hypothetical protein [Sphaerimonospora mesophila]|uniref:hypothetical protein n=1 Tax=Sphaerimonospora mesophila TaxID=37483 RepID=UPI000A678804